MNPATSAPKLPRNAFIQTILSFFTNRRAVAVGLIFSSDSLLFGSWVAHIPFVKSKLLLSDSELGMALFAMPAGLLVMNPLTGWVISKLGEARACFWAAIGMSLAVCIPINAPNVVVMVAGLFLAGLSGALINVAMNTSATNLERAEGIVIMSSCHGMWSLGGLVGSGVAGAVIALHVPPPVHMVTIALLILTLTFVLQPMLRQIPSSSRD